MLGQSGATRLGIEWIRGKWALAWDTGAQTVGALRVLGSFQNAGCLLRRNADDPLGYGFSH
jgi:hypothetical protein